MGCSVHADLRPDARFIYNRRLLLALYSTTVRLPPEAADRVHRLGLRTVCRLHLAGVKLRHYRGRRGGHYVRMKPTVRSLGNGASIVTGNRPAARYVQRSEPTHRLSVHVDRHGAPADRQLTFGCNNVRSLRNKTDTLLDIRRQQSLDVMFIVESWCDANSVCLQQMRAAGYNVVDKPRPRLRTRVDALSVNHGGIVVIAVAGVRLMVIDVGVSPRSFELLCVRVSSGSSSCLAVVVYRPGSAAVTQSFFVELSDVLDRVMTYADPIYVVGDFNVRLDRPEDPTSRQLTDTFVMVSNVV